MPFDYRTLQIPHTYRPTGSVRDRLESDAWTHYPALARKLAARAAHRREARLYRHRTLRWQDRALLLLAIVLMSLLLLRVETARADETPWGLELLTAAGTHTQLALHTGITTEITGLVARVEVTQEFTNPGQLWAEGIYRFPLPDGAAVDRLRIQAGSRIIEGEIQEKQQARRTYQQARREGRTASSVEQQSPSQFETRLANIGPGETVRVTIGFLQNVYYADGVFSLRLPTTFTPRWEAPTNHSVAAPAPQPALITPEFTSDHGLDMQVMLRSGSPLATIESRYHDIDIEAVQNGYSIRLLHGRDRTDRDFELSWSTGQSAEPRATLTTWDGGDAIYAQLMLVPPLAQSLAPRPREVVFVIDTSGSMEGASITQARGALQRGLAELGRHDAFNVIQFNSKTERLFPSSLPATARNLQQATDYIEDLEAGGGTDMAPALHAAFTLPVQPGLLRQVVFVTDGSVNNERALLEAIGVQLGESRLFTVGIGSAPNSWFMRKAAEIGRGSHTHIGAASEVGERMVQLWRHLRHPALADICLDWGQHAEYYPEIIPDLYAGQPLWVVAKLPAESKEISLCGNLNGRDWETYVTPVRLAGGETLATLWARRKIEALEDSLMFGADRDSTRKQVTDVALEYGLLSAGTALVAVDRSPARPAEEPLAGGEVPSLLPAGSTFNVAGFPRTASGWKAQFFLSLLTMALAIGMYVLSPYVTRGIPVFRGSRTRRPLATPTAFPDAAS